MTSFGADRKILENKLLRLTTAQQFALVEEIELFWENVSQEKTARELAPSGNRGTLLCRGPSRILICLLNCKQVHLISGV